MVSGMVAIGLDDSDEELRSLAAWLRDEDEFRGRVHLKESVQSGQMGGALDAVTLAISSGTASILVTSIFGWLKHRREARKVSLKLRDDSGREFNLTCGSADDTDKIIDNIRRFLSDET